VTPTVTPVAKWSVVVPLKPLDRAKSRLQGLPSHLRKALVVAMALDVRDAVLACRGVAELVVVTRDPRWHSLLSAPRLRVVADSPTDSLNDALRRGATTCRSTRPRYGIAALMADLPAMEPGELQFALDQAQGMPSAFVPDAHGDGTTLFAARSHEQFWPHYGGSSRSRHIEAGAEGILHPELTGIRRDVDTVEDLRQARPLGLGHRTSAVVVTITETHSFRAPAARR
jgi:2-phospho-L-lactate/phosphoenolpyruvate guanylyltransferase